MEIFGKVVMLLGSPHKDGSTYTALKELESALLECGVESEIINIGSSHTGCTACYACKGLSRCAINDGVNEIADKIDECDGVVLASPVYYASPNGGFLAFLDRLFYSSGKRSKAMKVGASVVSARRGGCTASFDVLNKYFTISGMPLVSSNYWNQIHGGCAEDAREDLEGLQTMRTLGRNMAFLIRAIKLARASGIEPSAPEKKIYTNFIKR